MTTINIQAGTRTIKLVKDAFATSDLLYDERGRRYAMDSDRQEFATADRAFVFTFAQVVSASSRI